MASATSLKTGSPLGTHSLARYRSEFPIFRDKVYLNTCSLGALDERTALVATSHVYFTSGAIQDIKAVADAARQCGALTVIDAYQAVGQVPVDVKAAGVDVLMAGGLKWLLGGPGIVFLYVREELAPRLAPAIAGWFGHRNQFAFDPRALELHDDARRFELGTPSLAAVYAQLGGPDYIHEIGVPAIRAVTGALAEDLIA